jgi:hypothetical protein
MRRPGPRSRLALAAIAVALAATPSSAQETRAATIERAQAEKATRLHPYVPNRGERLSRRVERALTNPPGFYVWFGSVYRGGQFALGPGVRRRLGETGLFDAHAALSLRNYKTVDTSLALPTFAGGRVRVTGIASWLDAPRVAFYGIGNDTTKPDDGVTRFVYRATTVGARGEAKVVGPLSAGGAIDYLRVDSSASRRDPFGGAAALFDATPSWTRSTAFVRLDTRPSPAYARRGTLLRAQWWNYAQQAGTGSAFRQFEAEAAQLLPILRENWIIALRARVTTTDTDPGQQVPFYLMPSLGGGSSIRGYHSWRFRDRHALLLNAEYRWTPSPYLDLALFLDAGRVAARKADLDLDDLHTGYGIGARFHTSSSMVLRIDLGRSTEGVALHWSASQGF